MVSQEINARVARITKNLRSPAGLTGEFLAPQTLDERLAFLHTPGVSVAVINDFQLDWARGFGVDNRRTCRPVTTATLFQAGSISKPVFALAVMKLAQDGVLDLDEDVNRYLSSWQVPARGDWQPKLTLRQLLSHTAGLTVHGFPGYLVSENVPTLTQVLNGEAPANTEKVEVNLMPGTTFCYSGGGTIVAQQLMVDLLGKPFPQLMQELVFDPLALHQSSFTQPLLSHWADLAATSHSSKGIPLIGGAHVYPEMAAAGLWTTATDLATIGLELLNVVHGRAAPRLLSKTSIDAMFQPQLSGQHIGEFDVAGLGFFMAQIGGQFRFGHSGWDEGFIAKMLIYRDLGKGAVIMVNSNGGFALIDELMHAIAIEYAWPEAIAKKKDVVSLKNLSGYVGSYRTESGLQFQLSLINDQLMLHYRNQAPLPIRPTSAFEFFSDVLNLNIRFEKDEKNNVLSLFVEQPGSQIRAERSG